MRPICAWASWGCGHMSVALFVLALLAAPAAVGLADEPGLNVPGGGQGLAPGRECQTNADGSCKYPGEPCYHPDRPAYCVQNVAQQCVCAPI